jgi:hypothetical protein
MMKSKHLTGLRECGRGWSPCTVWLLVAPSPGHRPRRCSSPHNSAINSHSAAIASRCFLSDHLLPGVSTSAAWQTLSCCRGPLLTTGERVSRPPPAAVARAILEHARWLHTHATRARHTTRRQEGIHHTALVVEARLSQLLGSHSSTSTTASTAADSPDVASELRSFTVRGRRGCSISSSSTACQLI